MPDHTGTKVQQLQLYFLKEIPPDLDYRKGSILQINHVGYDINKHRLLHLAFKTYSGWRDPHQTESLSLILSAEFLPSHIELPTSYMLSISPHTVDIECWCAIIDNYMFIVQSYIFIVKLYILNSYHVCIRRLSLMPLCECILIWLGLHNEKFSWKVRNTKWNEKEQKIKKAIMKWMYKIWVEDKFSD